MNFNYLPLLTDAAAATDLMNNPMSFGERVLMGLQVTLFGMAVVFAVLILLWGILEIFRVLFYELPKKKAAEAEAAKAAEKPAEPAPAEEPVMAAEETVTDDAEIVAAITAAISVVMDKPQTSFRVVSFRRTASK